jgi:ribosome-associated protein
MGLTESGDIHVRPGLHLPASELSWRFTRSGGPGGQHVNKTASRVELSWNPATSATLSDSTRELLLRRLATRLDADGSLRIVASDHRSQHRNRGEAAARLSTLLADALRPRKRRVPTRPTHSSKRRRLDAKRRRGETKQRRRPPQDW